MKRLFGNTGGLKAGQIRRLEKLYRRRLPPQFLITLELARDISRLSHEIRRQIGLLINRQGKIVYVIVGNHHGIVIPDTSEYRVAPGRLRGLRCIHTHLNNEPLTREDLTDLALLRLDIMAAITMTREGDLHQVHGGYVLPKSSAGKPFEILKPLNPNELDIGCIDLIQSLEAELDHVKSLFESDTGKERALLVSVTTISRHNAMASLAELEDLTASSGIEIVGTMLQQRRKLNTRFLMGMGKLQDLIILALQKGATLIIFDQELNPSQIRSITNKIDLKVIDRTQLILDIFSQRAQSKEGKLQVELAQLKYLLPRLITKNTAMSRLTGGIGGRGPGETKLEINRRRVRERIARLENALSLVMKQRKQQRAKRTKKGLAVISIIGYTNAGKSTLLNTLTKSNVRAESRLFATLDPSSRRLKFPRDIEVIITDTVGFIKNLPKDLMVAFRATLEELNNADLLLHVIDISNPRFKDQIESVENILADLNLHHIPLTRVLNKKDLVDQTIVDALTGTLGGIAISANVKSTLMPLIEKMEASIHHRKDFSSG
ncbi:MAG: GTPase HflX [Deltaproteobacteria bacterium]|nr:GTPase HflX [Deltaproteobacteria bacterium]MBW2641957.1 GTPase HflX [Deltaproteobacteria bacterium]